ncbi:hypothetical protein L1887_08985 [Cichorium endivia]|nr:hypothetical protein L1887_08985 [Cichorium endivia]
MNKILKELHKSCQRADGTDDQKKRTQLLEVYAIEIQMASDDRKRERQTDGWGCRGVGRWIHLMKIQKGRAQKRMKNLRRKRKINLLNTTWSDPCEARAEPS